MTPEREQEIRAYAKERLARDPWLAVGYVEELVDLLDAERVRCADLKRERDVERASHRLADASWRRTERERDGWKTRAELCARCTPERDHNGVLCRGCANARVAVLEKALARAAYVAEHLFAMIDRKTWRDSGGDDMQGHYEGDYHAEQTLAEINEWTALAVSGRPGSSAPAEGTSLLALASRLTVDEYVTVWVGEPGAPDGCPHCHVELVDGTCVAGCYYPAGVGDVGPTDE